MQCRYFEEGSTFTIGKAAEVRNGSDVTIVANGIMVVEAIKAADMLKEKGVHARILNMFTLKPLDESAIIQAAKEQEPL